VTIRALVLTIIGVLLASAFAAWADEPATQPASADWPQFRGPNRDGVAVESPRLLDAWPAGGPKLLWKSEWTEGRNGRENGCSSPVMADGKVFVYLNLKVPKDGGTKFKPITTELLMAAGWLPDLPEDLAAKIETARAARPQGKNMAAEAPVWWDIEPPSEAELDAFLAKNPDLDKHIKDFVATLPAGEAKKYGAYVKRRFCMFKEYTWEELVKLSGKRDTEVVSAERWWGWSGVRERTLLGKTAKGNWQIKDPEDNLTHGSFAINAYMRACKITDTVACLDEATGKTLWKKDFPVDVRIFKGEGKSWSVHGGFDNFGVSSTPTICGGKCYVVGALGLYCLSVKDGAMLWKVPGEPEHASPLVADGLVYHCAAAYDAESGRLLWTNPNYKPDKKPWYSTLQRFVSPQLWTSGGANYIIATDARRLCALDMKTGSTLWTIPESKFSLATWTPVVCGDILIGSGGADHGVQAVKMTTSGIEPLWRRKDVSSYGPLIDEGYVYCFSTGKDHHSPEWKCLDFKTGEDVWTGRLRFSDSNPPPPGAVFLYGGSGDVISTPILADGKIIELWGSAHFSGGGYRWIQMLAASTDRYIPLAQADLTTKIAGITSPAFSQGKLFFRLQDGGVGCFDLTEGQDRATLAAQKPASGGSAILPQAPATEPAKPRTGPSALPSSLPGRPATLPDLAARPAGWAKNWPQFRGPSGDGQAGPGADLPVKLNLAQDKRYSTSLPASGRSSPIVWNDRVYLTGDDGSVMALDAVTGKLLWNTAIEATPATGQADREEPGPPSGGGSTGPATPTPVTDGQFVYAFFGNGIMGCVNANGKQVWARRLTNSGPRNTYGLASSPVLYGDLLIQVVDRGRNAAANASFVVAVATKDGAEAWRKGRPVGSCWTTPIIVRGPAGDMLVTTAPSRVIAYDPRTGQERWQAEGSSNGELTASPVPCGDGAVVLAGSEGLTALKAGGKGDVTKSGHVWTSDVSPPKVPSPVGGDGRCYILCDGGLACVDAANGKEKWNLELEGEFWASPVLAKDRIYAINRKGMLFVVSTAGKKLDAVQLDGGVEATPAIVAERLYVRTRDSLLCLGRP
jgi:outer membrane protein assembly factor BamB